MSFETYNGWGGGYPTWRVNLEILDGQAEYFIDTITDGDREPYDDVLHLSDAIQEDVNDYFEQELPDEMGGVFASYAQWFLDQVDYYEIAESWVEDYPDLIKQEDD